MQPVLTDRWVHRNVVGAFILWTVIALTIASCSLTIADLDTNSGLRVREPDPWILGLRSHWWGGLAAAYFACMAINLLRQGLDSRDALVIDSEGIFYPPVSPHKIVWADITGVRAPWYTGPHSFTGTYRLLTVDLRLEDLDRLVPNRWRRFWMRWTGTSFVINARLLDKGIDDILAAVDRARPHSRSHRAH